MAILTKALTKAEMSETLADLEKLRHREKAIKSKIQTLQDELKQHMTLKGIVSFEHDGWTVRWTPMVKRELDTKALRADLPQIVAAYTRETETRRFEAVKRA